MPTNDPIAEDMERAYRDLDAENTEARATIARLREENERLDAHVQKLSGELLQAAQRNLDVRCKRDEARALLREMCEYLESYGGKNNAIMSLSAFHAQMRQMLAGDRQGGASEKDPLMTAYRRGWNDAFRLAPGSTPDAGTHD